MREKDKQHPNYGVNEEASKLSRREFLKDAGTIIGGAALVSLASSAACNNTETSSTTSSIILPSTTIPPVSNSTPTASTSVNTTATTPVGTTTTPPPTSTSGILPLVDTPGCTSKVATDRLYSIEHIWVKKLGNDTVQIGITDKFQLLIGLINTCWVSAPGAILRAGESFGDIEGNKMNADIIGPVSGQVLERNVAVMARPQPLNGDPYTSGWLLKIQLSKPAELNNLVAPLYYAYLQSVGWAGSVPAMH
jgi:glycine cleavage system H protein